MASVLPSPNEMKREKTRPDAVLVGLDLLDGQELAALVLAGRIAHPCRAAAHERDRLAGAGLLQPMQHHDGEQVPHMEGGPVQS